jgi:hypothetical protein
MSALCQKRTKCTAVKRTPFDRPVREREAKDTLVENSRVPYGESFGGGFRPDSSSFCTIAVLDTLSGQDDDVRQP